MLTPNSLTQDIEARKAEVNFPHGTSVEWKDQDRLIKRWIAHLLIADPLLNLVEFYRGSYLVVRVWVARGQIQGFQNIGLWHDGQTKGD